MHNTDGKRWEVVNFGPGRLPGVRGIQEIVCREDVTEKMYDHGIEEFYIDTRIDGDERNIASCMTNNYEEVVTEIFHAN